MIRVISIILVQFSNLSEVHRMTNLTISRAVNIPGRRPGILTILQDSEILTILQDSREINDTSGLSRY